MNPYGKSLVLIFVLGLFSTVRIFSQDIPGNFIDPPRDFSVMPFWFWNDTLKDQEIVRQIADFESHGVYGFVIHPRIGLPENVTWLSPAMIHSMRVAIEEASKRNMNVILYDEGMYPSGSSSGQVVARNPDHAARGLAKIDLKPGQSPSLKEGMKLITVLKRMDGSSMAIVEQPSHGVIRGLHYIGEGTQSMREELPPAGDILNPDAVTSFIDLVYDRYAKEFGSYFGKTITGIFTDEPSPLGRASEREVVPGDAALLTEISRVLGYDFMPFLADLWYNDDAESLKHRSDYYRAISTCLGENYYRRLSEWCDVHGIALMGHPAGSMDIGAERYFQVPGQDLVWRYVEPGLKALNGEHSTMAKCASGAMLHSGKKRNSNELYGAYGHNLTYDEMLWLANWCFVRGQNLLIPHAFYYSVRGPRLEERPPDVGPNSKWWDDYRRYADGCRRMSWLNTGSKHICDIAVLCEESFLPCKAASILFRNQLDFNYLETDHLIMKAKTDGKGVHIAGMNYRVVIIDSISHIPDAIVPQLKSLAENGRLIVSENSGPACRFKGAVIVNDDKSMISALDRVIRPDIELSPASEDIRLRHVVKDGIDYCFLFNEDENNVTITLHHTIKGTSLVIDPFTMNTQRLNTGEPVSFKPHEIKILIIRK